MMRKKWIVVLVGAACWGSGVPEMSAEPESEPAYVGEIRLPEPIEQVKISKIMEFERVPGAVDRLAQYVVRRMTKSRFEVWQPTHGWLFDSEGRLLHEAVPPRRDGEGRGWYGAFLPDGRWVTTDLWAYDKTLTFFSAGGKWVRERSALQLAPQKKSDPPHDIEYADIIAWARCDRDGKGWVASIGTNSGRAIVFVKPDGKAHPLHTATEPWKLCYPRDLEPKGWPKAWWCYRRCPSDDGKWLIRCAEYGHGEEVMHPPYQWGERAKLQWKDGYEEVQDGQNVTGGDSNFGFLPGSHDVFIGAIDLSNPDSMIENSGVNWTVGSRPFKTTIFAASRTDRGWLKGAYLADSADGKAMWFLDTRRGVVVLGNDLKVQSRLQFSVENIAALPYKVFPDLRIGVFRVDGKYILAKW